MSEEKKYIPDAQGTVAVKGFENLVKTYVIDDASAKRAKELADETKEKFKHEAYRILAQSAEGAVRVLFRDKKGRGVTMTEPDYSTAGNRPVFSAGTIKALTEAGGLEVLGKEKAKLIEETTKIVLTGEKAKWFKEQMAKFVESGALTPDKAAQDAEEVTERRIKAAAIPRLKELCASGSEEAKEVAAILLDKGRKTLLAGIKD